MTSLVSLIDETVDFVLNSPDNLLELPETQQTITFTNHGKPKDVLKMYMHANVPKKLRDGHVLVRVSYAAINPIDWVVIKEEGLTRQIAPDHYPGTPLGYDYSGRIVALGDDVNTQFEIGDRVFGNTDHVYGSFAQFMEIHWKYVHKIPSNISLFEASAYPLVIETAYDGLVSIAKLNERQNANVLILGGSSAVGMMAIQICKFFGCRNIVTTSRQEDLCRALGATYVINYRKEDWLDVIKNQGYTDSKVQGDYPRFDILFAAIGAKEREKNIWSKSCEILKSRKENGISVSPADFEPLKEQTDKMPTMRPYLTKSQFDRFEECSKLIQNRIVNTIINPISPYMMDEYKEMFEKSISGRASGKLVMRICG